MTTFTMGQDSWDIMEKWYAAPKEGTSDPAEQLQKDERALCFIQLILGPLDDTWVVYEQGVLPGRLDGLRVYASGSQYLRENQKL